MTRKDIINNNYNREIAYTAIRWCATGHSNGMCVLSNFYKEEILFKYIKNEISYSLFKEKTSEYKKELLKEINDKKDHNLALIYENIQAVSYYIYVHTEYKNFINNFKELNIETLAKLHEEVFDGNETIKGNIRVHNISKKEEVLNGNSAKYTYYYDIYKELNNFFNFINEINWNNLSNKEKAVKFSDILVSLWIIHPFYEGSTRVTSLFMELYAYKVNLNIDFDILYQNPKEYRDSLVLYSLSNNNNLLNKDKLIEKVFNALK